MFPFQGLGSFKEMLTPDRMAMSEHLFNLCSIIYFRLSRLCNIDIDSKIHDMQPNVFRLNQNPSCTTFFCIQPVGRVVSKTSSHFKQIPFLTWIRDTLSGNLHTTSSEFG